MPASTDRPASPPASGYAKWTSRNRSSFAPPGTTADPEDGCSTSRTASSNRASAATGALAPSSAQLRPPNATDDTPIAACTNTTTLAVEMSPSAARSAMSQKTPTFAAVTMPRHAATERSRSRVASNWRSYSRRRVETKRSITQPARPKKRTSFAGDASTASRYE
ncbi:MAG: hypothetical protein AB7L17_00960 [Ilumatobacteraceae bacterium]